MAVVLAMIGSETRNRELTLWYDCLDSLSVDSEFDVDVKHLWHCSDWSELILQLQDLKHYHFK